MKQQIRKSVFETNSSTQHTLTIQRQIVPVSGLSFESGRIPSDTIFKFTNSKVKNIEYSSIVSKYGVPFATEVDKLALCVAFCCNAYETMLYKETNQWFWNYMEEADCDENGNYDINAVVKDKPFFKELYQAIKEVRNTELVLVNVIHELDSINDNMAFESLFDSYRENIDRDYVDDNLVTFFKNVIFGDYTIFDKLLPC